MKILRKRSLITVNILYWIPDYNNIVQEFLWQTEDIVPDYPRLHQFLFFWQHEIDAIIKEIRLMNAGDDTPQFRLFDELKTFH